MFDDPRALWGATGLAVLVIGTLQVLVPVVQRRDQAILIWGIGNLIGGVGAILVAFRGEIPEVASVAFSNALLVGARAMFWAGFRTFNRQSFSWWLVLVPPVAIGFATISVPGIAGNPPLRVAVVTLFYLCYTVGSLVDGLRAERHEKLVWRRAIIFVLAAWTVVVIARAIFGLIAPPSIDPTQASSTEAFTPLVGLVLAVMNGFNTILLARERLERELIDAAFRDFQTGTFNRAGLYDKAQELLERRGRSEVGVLLMDLDEFKSINDRFGHIAGDQVLADFASVARNNLPPGGVLARFGGEEFCALLPQSGLEEAELVAERIREAFEQHELPLDGLVITATVSIGVATVSSGEGSIDVALSEADRALYAAKAVGRNKVVAGPLPWRAAEDDLMATE